MPPLYSPHDRLNGPNTSTRLFTWQRGCNVIIAGTAVLLIVTFSSKQHGVHSDFLRASERPHFIVGPGRRLR